ncbi:hypothetical protein LCL95_02735 [Bacillus timonensis]|nr:hypothetical protein [Bacillus timonensis]
MNLATIWDVFLTVLNKNCAISQCHKKDVAGIPFLYVTSRSTEGQHEFVNHLIKLASAEAMKGKRLTSETIFVRKEHNVFVYRHRFYVPQEKMFCCGNICVDCIRFRER